MSGTTEAFSRVKSDALIIAFGRFTRAPQLVHWRASHVPRVQRRSHPWS